MAPELQRTISGGTTPRLTWREKIFRRRTWIIRAAGLLLLLGLAIATAATLGRRDILRIVLAWIHANPVGGGFIFVLLYCWFAVVFLPVALLAIAAGAVWGMWPGLPLVWVSAMLGETIAFLMGRFLLRKWVNHLTADWPMWHALNAALREDGWKLVALLRVSPATPFSIINYALGSSKLPFCHYFWPSVIGIFPTCVIETYLGAAAVDITEVMSDHGASTPVSTKIIVTVLTAVSAVVAAILSAVYTKRAIDQRLAQLQVTEQLTVTEQHVRLLEDGGGSFEGSQGPGSIGSGAAEEQLPGLKDEKTAGKDGRRVVMVVEEPRLVVVRVGEHQQQRRPGSSSGNVGQRSSPVLNGFGGHGGSSEEAHELLLQHQHHQSSHGTDDAVAGGGSRWSWLRLWQPKAEDGRSTGSGRGSSSRSRSSSRERQPRTSAPDVPLLPRAVP